MRKVEQRVYGSVESELACDDIANVSFRPKVSILFVLQNLGYVPRDGFWGVVQDAHLPDSSFVDPTRL